MTVTGVIGVLVVGLIIGVLGPTAVPGTQRLPIWLTVVLGIGAPLTVFEHLRTDRTRRSTALR